MTETWDDFEDGEVINKWRKEKIKFVSDNKRSIYISRKLLFFILNRIYSEGALEITEKFETEYVPDEGWVPPILQDWEKKKGRMGARERLNEEILDPHDLNGRGKTLEEIKQFRAEAEKLSKELEGFFDVCPRCQSPNEYCSAHC